MIKKEEEKLVMKKGKKKSKAMLESLLLILFLAAIGLAGWSYSNWQEAQKKIKALSSVEGQQELLKKDKEDLVAKVKKHIVLPEGEEPQVYNITDIDALSKQQPFYIGAHNGDRILIYSAAKQGFVYDPNRDIIVKVGPVYTGNSAKTTDTENGDLNSSLPSTNSSGTNTGQ